MTEQFFILDLREEWRRRPYLTLWRPNNAGYCYSLPWAGLYDRETVDEGGAYYAKRVYQQRNWMRFPVPRNVVEALAVPPRPGIIDGDVGPVLLNDARTKAALRLARYVPQRLR